MHWQFDFSKLHLNITPIAQELRQVFPEHIQVLEELAMKDQGISFKDFHQVDKQALVMDRK